jgi:LysM repeat protein
MKKTIITTGLIALAVSAFSAGVQAKPNLSITPISEAQANAMRSQGVSRGSSISTTVTIGGRGVRSNTVCDQHGNKYRTAAHARRVGLSDADFGATYCDSYKPHLRQKWLAKQAKVIIKHAVAMYTVRKGDTLYRIAKRYETTVERLMRINKLRSTTIHIGQTLKV